ncbi:MAG: RagB/SusD family nutrient uptake outer membrane protein, partial [Chryseolinea sp.]
ERSTFEDCINFMVEDLDQAATLLDGYSMEPGRASKLAALALKSRILLYAASDLHDQAAASTASTLLSGYTEYKFVGYTSGAGSQSARWQLAKDAAEAALAVGVGYKLDLVAPATFEEAKANHIALSMGGGSGIADKAAGVELILQRTQTPLYTVENNWPLGGIHFGINNGPNGYHNWAGNTPIQQLVDDYQMMDGSKFDYGNVAHASAPYENREPRFYATILYDGADWKPRPSDVASYDKVNQIQTGYYDGGLNTAGDPIIINGVDTRESPVENWNGSRTHYYVRKFIDSDPNVVDNQSGSQVVPWPFIRYTELVLNYVEACLGVNDEVTAITWLNKIRFRAGLPAVVETGSALIDLYRNERRLELVYEEHRYHDARRWMIAPTTLGRGIKIMRVDAKLKVGKSPLSPYKHDKTIYDYTYAVQNNTDNETRTWNDKMYFRPISRDEINRNEKLKGHNNPGYGNE